jgi:hypothetical protein
VTIATGKRTLQRLTVIALSSIALATVVAPPAGADDRTCTNTSANTTICSRPGGSTSINTSPPPVAGPYSSCGFGVGMDYMCGGGVTWNLGGIFSNRR